MTNIKELMEVKTVLDALSLIYSQFGDPLSDRDPRLVEWVELLEEYSMSKDAQRIITDEEIRLSPPPRG